MPREDRRIYFEKDEVYKAIYSLCFQKQLHLPPPGQVLKIATGDMSKDRVVLTLHNPQTKQNNDAEYAQDFMAAALMLYCRGAGIPLPKKAQKTVMIVDGDVILKVEIGSKKAG